MIGGLGQFVRALRSDGIRVSPAEWLDAVRALEQVGLEDRDRFRAALRATLVKRHAQQERFDRAFEAFFAPPRFRRNRRRGRGEPTGLAAGSGGRGHEATQPTSAPPAGEDRSRSPKIVPSRADRAALTRLHEGQTTRVGRLARVLLTPRGPAGSTTADAGGAVRDLTRKPLTGRWNVEDERRLVRELRRVIERIRLGAGRRVRADSRGQVYPRRLFRASQKSAGVPFVLPRRRHRPRRPRVTLLIDVSWSVERAAGLFLALAGEFLAAGRQTRILLFVDRPVEATKEIEHWWRSRRPRPFRELLESLPELNLHAASDYGRTFDRLLRSRHRPGRRRDLLLVLGDGRTNRFDPLAWALQEILADCGATLWLVPEPFSRWGLDDSALPAYLPWVDAVVETADLNGLGRGVAELVRRLR